MKRAEVEIERQIDYCANYRRVIEGQTRRCYASGGGLRESPMLHVAAS